MIYDQSWRDNAACREVPVDTFYPGTDGETEPAKSVCTRCGVREMCLEMALTGGERFGIWGGLTPAERRSLGGWHSRDPGHTSAL